MNKIVSILVAVLTLGLFRKKRRDTSSEVFFGELEVGDYFEYNGQLYVKVDKKRAALVLDIVPDKDKTIH